MIITVLYLGAGIIAAKLAWVRTQKYLQLDARTENAYMTPQLWLWLFGVIGLYVASLVLTVIGVLRILG